MEKSVEPSGKPKRTKSKLPFKRTEIRRAFDAFKDAGIEVGGLFVKGNSYAVLAKSRELDSFVASIGDNEWDEIINGKTAA
jgi:hypothetical protein